MSTDIGPVLGYLADAESSIGYANACLLGAANATAPADRWGRAADHMAAVTGWLDEARAALTALDKREPYCTSCGQPLLSGTDG